MAPPEVVSTKPCPLVPAFVERPTLFSAPMVRALLDGTKTQTRRVVKWKGLEPSLNLQFSGLSVERSGSNFVLSSPTRTSHEYRSVPMPCRYGQPGDRLWVRETWQFHDWTADGEPIIGYAADNDTWLPVAAPDLSDTWAALSDPANYAIRGRACDQRWRPSIHMPRWASRIDLEITAVRVERLQDISEADADAEGCERLDNERDERDWKLCPQCGGTRMYTAHSHSGAFPDTDCTRCDTYVKRYQHLWEAINGAGSWNANPWVWVVEFRRIRP